MAQALVQNLFVEGFRGGANTDIVGTFQIQVVNEGGDPADISDATGSSFTAKKSYAATDTIININANNGIVIDANTSTLTLAMTVAHLSGVNLSRESQDFVYDWDFTIDGRRHRFMRGVLTVGGDV